jgi:hypothetical protein
VRVEGSHLRSTLDYLSQAPLLQVAESIFKAGAALHEPQNVVSRQVEDRFDAHNRRASQVSQSNVDGWQRSPNTGTKSVQRFPQSRGGVNFLSASR